MGVNIFFLELTFSLINFYQQQKLKKKDILREKLFLWKKRQKALEKKPGCKFIRINTTNAKDGHDLDYEVGNVQAFIGEFKNKKIKKTRKKINRKIIERESRKRNEKESTKRNERKIRKRNERKIRKGTKRQKQRIKNFNKQPSY